LQLHHSGRYRCGGWMNDVYSQWWQKSTPVTLRVHRVPVSGVSLSAHPPGGQVALGDHLVMSCAVTTGTGPLSFSWHREGSVASLDTGPSLDLYAGAEDSGHYLCRATNGDS
ncbi:FCRL2 protein, partial [Pitta sordida]|nr:FCRL2 protein [Pitta sordida]